jgi:hypothetical protein
VSATLSGDNDAQLFLFDESGLQILFNDDSGPGLLPQFNPGDLTGQPTGNYYLAFNLYETNPNSDPLAGWDRDPAPFQTGPYTLSLTGVTAVPEPTSLLASLGLTSFGMFLKGKKGKK